MLFLVKHAAGPRKSDAWLGVESHAEDLGAIVLHVFLVVFVCWIHSISCRACTLSAQTVTQISRISMNCPPLAVAYANGGIISRILGSPLRELLALNPRALETHFDLIQATRPGIEARVWREL